MGLLLYCLGNIEIWGTVLVHAEYHNLYNPSNNEFRKGAKNNGLMVASLVIIQAWVAW